MCNVIPELIGNTFSIAMAAPFAALRRFPKGRGFKQWMGDDSKALMKVRTIINLKYLIALKIIAQIYLPAIDGHLPQDMIRAMRAFLDFCYIAR